MCVGGGGGKDEEICSGFILIPVSGSCPHLHPAFNPTYFRRQMGWVGNVWQRKKLSLLNASISPRRWSR